MLTNFLKDVKNLQRFMKKKLLHALFWPLWSGVKDPSFDGEYLFIVFGFATLVEGLGLTFVLVYVFSFFNHVPFEVTAPIVFVGSFRVLEFYLGCLIGRRASPRRF